jgi:hypothetical protein
MEVRGEYGLLNILSLAANNQTILLLMNYMSDIIVKMTKILITCRGNDVEKTEFSRMQK